MWYETRRVKPPSGLDVMTKIDDANGCRNVQRLRWNADNKMWWSRGMYVYYTPTHWKFV